VTPAAHEPLAGRAKWAQRALIAVVVLNAIGVVSALFAYQLYGSDLITQDDLDRTDLREGLVALLTFIAYLSAIVFFISWFRRAYRNLPVLGATGLRYRSGWTIGSWFIPIVGLILPKQIANDIWRARATPTNARTWGRSGRATRSRRCISGGGASSSWEACSAMPRFEPSWRRTTSTAIGGRP